MIFRPKQINAQSLIRMHRYDFFLKINKRTCSSIRNSKVNRYLSDLSNEVLYILVGQEAAKISEIKVGGQKKSARSRGLRVNQSRI